MCYNVLILEDAESDIDNAFLWYEFRQIGLGDRFYEKVNEGIAYIANNPSTSQKIYKKLRRYMVHNFPYGIYYLINENEKLKEMNFVKCVGPAKGGY